MPNEQFDAARADLLEATRQYFHKHHPGSAFIPGQTYIPVTTKVLDAEDLVHLVDASLDLWLTAGRYARELEATLPSHFNRKTKSLLVNSGSSANLVAVSSLGSPALKGFGLRPLEKGDEVLTVAAGFPTTVNPIVQNGWIPVFVDIDGRTLNATLELLQAAKTPRTRAVVLAHTLGNPYRADLIAEWCKQENLYLVEDCCDALGATIGSAPAGSFGEFATLSFYPAHHITMGEGGAVLPKDGRWKKIAESLRDWGRDCWCEPGKDNTCHKRFDWQLGALPQGYDHKYIYSHIGYNLKVTDMQAAVGLSQLNKVGAFIEARRSNWRKLREGIRNSPLLSEFYEPVEATEGTDPSWFGFPMYVRGALNREKVVRFLENNKVGTRLLFAGNITKQPAYSGVEFRVHGSLTQTDRVMTDVFWIGVHPKLDDQRIAYMLEQLEAAAKTLR